MTVAYSKSIEQKKNMKLSYKIWKQLHKSFRLERIMKADKAKDC